MKDEFEQYIISLYKDIPQEVYEGLLSVFCIGLVVIYRMERIQNRAPLFSRSFVDRIHLSHLLLNSIL